MGNVVALDPPVFGTTWGTAPDDGTNAKATDVRQLAQMCLTNDQWLYELLFDGTGELDLELVVTNELLVNGNAEVIGTLTADTILANTVTATTVTADTFAFGDVQTVTRVVNIAHAFQSLDVSNLPFWAQTTTAPAGGWITRALVGSLLLELDVPHGATLKEVRVTVYATLGMHGGSLPTGMPSIELFSVDETGTSDPIASASDTSPNIAAYVVAHPISITGHSVAIDRSTKRYLLRINQETDVGSNVKTGFHLTAVRVKYEIANLGLA